MSEALDTSVNDAPADDIRGSLAAAFEANAGSPESVSSSPGAEEAGADRKSAPASDQPRDETGKFAPKAADTGVKPVATIPTDQPAVASQEAPQEPIRPPASWSAQAKAKFATLDPEVQAEVLKRETEVNKGFEERAAKLKQYEPIEQVLAPVRSRLAMNGLNDATYIQALVSADEILRGPNKIQGFAQLAQQYGIDLRLFAQPGAPQPQPLQAQPPQVDIQAEIDRRFQALQHEQQTAQTQAEIDAFAKDHLYFENVKPVMAALLQSGVASDLADAYDRACRADPQIHQLISDEKARKTADEQRAAASARVNGARQAGGSLTGSPSPGAAPVQGEPPSIRESLLRQLA